jgi:hypothetical protein
MMWKIRDPLWLAFLAHQMQREVDDGEHMEAIRLHYAHLHGIVTTEAESREPGVIRRAWQLREGVAGVASVADESS